MGTGGTLTFWDVIGRDAIINEIASQSGWHKGIVTELLKSLPVSNPLEDPDRTESDYSRLLACISPVLKPTETRRLYHRFDSVADIVFIEKAVGFGAQFEEATAFATAFPTVSTASAIRCKINSIRVPNRAPYYGDAVLALIRHSWDNMPLDRSLIALYKRLRHVYGLDEEMAIIAALKARDSIAQELALSLLSMDANAVFDKVAMYQMRLTDYFADTSKTPAIDEIDAIVALIASINFDEVE